jgi:pimeloyl-ACP methyl ester carboxylesterase
VQRRDVKIEGARVAVFEAGAGEPCVLLHGYPQSHHCWRRVVPALAESHRVIAPDWPGWGESERSLAQALDYDAEVERIGALLDALGLVRANLLAHDYGGFLALGFAIRHPERLLRLAILNSRAHRTFPLGPYLQFAALSLFARAPRLFARLPLHAQHRRSLAHHVANGEWSSEDLERYLAFLKTADGVRWLAHFFAHYRVAVRPELAEGARAIRVPTAVIWGDADPYCPFAIAEDLGARIPQARVVRVRGADHYVMEERPGDVTAGLRELLGAPAITQ